MRWKSLYSFCRGLPVIHCFRFYVYLWQNCNLNAWQTYGCQWFVLARHHFLDYTRNWYRKQKQENEMDRCVLLGPNFPYFQCMRFYEIYLNEALSFQHCLHSRCFRWDENCFIALDVDFGLFVVQILSLFMAKLQFQHLANLQLSLICFRTPSSSRLREKLISDWIRNRKWNGQMCVTWVKYSLFLMREILWNLFEGGAEGTSTSMARNFAF